MREEGYGSGSLLLSFLLGGVVGAGLALLVAPQSGRETREKLRGYADNVREKTTGYVNEAREKVDAVIHEGKDFYEERKSILKSAIDAGKEAYDREKEKFTKA